MSKLINSCCPVMHINGNVYQCFIDEYVTLYHVSVFKKPDNKCCLNQKYSKFSKKEYKILVDLLDYIYSNI